MTYSYRVTYGHREGGEKGWMILPLPEALAFAERQRAGTYPADEVEVWVRL